MAGRSEGQDRSSKGACSWSLRAARSHRPPSRVSTPRAGWSACDDRASELRGDDRRGLAQPARGPGRTGRVVMREREEAKSRGSLKARGLLHRLRIESIDEIK